MHYGNPFPFPRYLGSLFRALQGGRSLFEQMTVGLVLPCLHVDVGLSVASLLRCDSRRSSRFFDSP